VVLVVPASVIADGPNDPHAPAVVVPQLALNAAPAPVASLLTSTSTVADAPSPSSAGGAGEKESAVGGKSIVSVTLLVAAGLLVTAAVMVTDPPIGTAVGAV
jgi:hypothetical protein